MLNKIDKLEELYIQGNTDFSLVRYIPDLVDIETRGQTNNFNRKIKYADNTYKDKNMLEFNIQLTKHHYINFSTLIVCLPIKIISKSNNANDIAAGSIQEHNIFAHWIKST